MGIIYSGSGLMLLIAFWYIWAVDNLIVKRSRVKQYHNGTCVALKQRNDMIPNLVATVKPYMDYKSEILTRIAELRSHSFQPSQKAGQMKSGNELSGLLTKLQLSVENYPELRVNEQFHRLQNGIEDMELQLQAIRRTCNAAITDYNSTIEMFPSSVVARQQGHHQEEPIDIPEPEQQNVNVAGLLR